VAYVKALHQKFTLHYLSQHNRTPGLRFEHETTRIRGRSFTRLLHWVEQGIVLVELFVKTSQPHISKLIFHRLQLQDSPMSTKGIYCFLGRRILCSWYHAAL